MMIYKWINGVGSTIALEYSRIYCTGRLVILSVNYQDDIHFATARELFVGRVLLRQYCGALLLSDVVLDESHQHFARALALRKRTRSFAFVYQDIAPSRVKAEVSACASGWLCTSHRHYFITDRIKAFTRVGALLLPIGNLSSSADVVTIIYYDTFD